ncbi:histidinol-phosphate transaminase [Lacrimispora sp. BS-2]|uniref:Histidinol-phosphate aminotransferase n=1 Tax=Lacrimispora sp. BS-2 TaxID=3151850 RepID=A0AAU7PJ29_9FIRM
MRPWEANIRRVAPYVPGEQPKGEKLIKLNTNENPYPPSKDVSQALAGMDCAWFRKYPDPAATVLIKALSKAYEVEEDRIFVGVGSDDVLAVAFMTFFNSKKPILFPDVSYSFYKVWADLFRIPYETPDLDEEFCIRKEDYYRENGGIIFPNPNAPTGLFMPLSEVEDIIAHNQESVIIVDEAYIDFGGESALRLTEKYENLLVVQTFSKSRSMAGMRIGCAYGHPDLICALNDVKYSYNSYTMNIPSLVLGAKALEDEAYFKETLEKIINTREQAKKRLGELGFSFPDSMANFIFATHRERRAEEIYKALRENNIFVRYFKQPRLDNHLRISVGTDEEMEALYSFLKEYL